MHFMALGWGLCACPGPPVHDFRTDPHVGVAVRMLMCFVLYVLRVVRIAFRDARIVLARVCGRRCRMCCAQNSSVVSSLKVIDGSIEALKYISIRGVKIFSSIDDEKIDLTGCPPLQGVPWTGCMTPNFFSESFIFQNEVA